MLVNPVLGSVCLLKNRYILLLLFCYLRGVSIWPPILLLRVHVTLNVPSSYTNSRNVTYAADGGVVVFVVYYSGFHFPQKQLSSQMEGKKEGRKKGQVFGQY
jgi:hypothetical protein